MSALAPSLQAWFTERLANQLHASPNTVAAYRDAWRLLLGYLHQQTGKQPSQLDLADLDAATISAFLDHLEADRHNSVRTRNARLAAIRSFFKFASLRHPEHAALIAHVLAIPTKRGDHPEVNYLNTEEITALVDSPDPRTWTGRRDRALIDLAVQTGLRVSELTGLRNSDIELGCGRVLEKLPQIIARLGAMADWFATTLDAASVGFISDRILDELPRPALLGATRVGGVSFESTRMRAALAAVAALAPAPKGFTITELAAKVHAMTGQTDADYSIRQAAYDLRNLRAKNLVLKPGATRRYQMPTHALRTITAITTLRDQVLAPLLRAVRAPRVVTDRSTWTDVERDYETLRADLDTLFDDLGIATAA